MRRIFLSLSALTVALLALSGCNSELTEEQIIEKAAQIHAEVLTVDTHNDTPMRFNNTDFDMAERHEPTGRRGGKVDFPRMKEGGLDAAFFAVFTGQGPRDQEGNERAYQRAVETYDNIHRVVNENTEIAGLALTPEDAYKIEKEGKRIVFIGMENGYPIGNDLSRVKEFYDRGTRYITLCHSSNNDICDSSTDRKGPEHGGLSEFGVKVVNEMNRLGIMVDISHASDESFYDAIETSKAPIIASHSCCYALCASPRNLKDDMLEKLAEKGGVLQMCILNSYLVEPVENPERDSAQAALSEKYGNFRDLSDEVRNQAMEEYRSLREKYPDKQATVKDVVNHIDHVVEVAGIDHVGIGTDFDGGGGIEDCNDVSQMGNITIELVRRGYSKKDIEKIWGGNIMRVMRAVEAAAETL